MKQALKWTLLVVGVAMVAAALLLLSVVLALTLGPALVELIS